MTLARFRGELKTNPSLRREVDRCAYVAMATAVQIAACNVAHLLQARLARWLLMMGDRNSPDEFPVTQDFIAQMLGVRREGVTQAAAALQRRKLIRYSRGSTTILNRVRLRASSCRCYKVIRGLERPARRPTRAPRDAPRRPRRDPPGIPLFSCLPVQPIARKRKDDPCSAVDESGLALPHQGSSCTLS